jgi:L-serine deaminase
VIRFCFAHNQQTYSMVTCLVGGWRGMSPCDVAYAEVTRFDDGEEG